MSGNIRARRREQKRKRMRAAVVAVAVCGLFYLFLSFFLGEMGLFRYMKLRGQKAAIKAEITSIKQSNEELRARVDALKTDPEYIERLAREQGLAKEGETVYQYENE
jgi:cell division protein FtsB